MDAKRTLVQLVPLVHPESDQRASSEHSESIQRVQQVQQERTRERELCVYKQGGERVYSNT